MKVIIFITSFFLICSACNHKNIVTGKVINNLNDAPINNAHLHNGRKVLATTDKHGVFKFEVSTHIFPQSTILKLQVSANDFHNIKQEIKLTDSINIDLRLQHQFDYSAIRNDIMDTVRSIAQGYFISSGVMGIAGKRPKQYDRRLWLRRNASNKELILLANFPNPIIKATVFEELFRSNHEKVPEIIKTIALDNSIIHVFGGCVGHPVPLNEYCFNRIMRYRLKQDFSIPLPPPPPHFNRRVNLDQQTENEIRNIISETNKEWNNSFYK